jgi:hypothetical protein
MNRRRREGVRGGRADSNAMAKSGNSTAMTQEVAIQVLALRTNPSGSLVGNNW